MKQLKVVLTLAMALAMVSGARMAQAQSDPTATRKLQLSAFGAVSGVYTGLGGGRNLSFTAGGDLGLPPWKGIRPSLEVRGTYPINGGNVDSQKDVLGGLKVEFLLRHRLRPYGDALFGRGQINYVNGTGHNIFGDYVYVLTTTNVVAGGGGVDYLLNEHFALKLDGQFERWGEAPTPSGDIYSKAVSAGVVYYFTFDGHRRR